MRSIFCVAFILCTIYNCIGQRIISPAVISPTSTYVKGNNFEGAIFSSEYNPDLGVFDITRSFRQYQAGISHRFTPSFSQAELAERILQKNLRHHNRKTAYQGRGYGPVIHRRLKKYQRQYLGYTSSDNEQIIFINASWERHTLIDRLQDLYPRDETWKSDYKLVLDGGSYYWCIEVNLTTGKLAGLGVNGIASFRPGLRESGEV
ncbi:hypothetical protein [Hymenobacter edaphi]|uniref:hypothetical protein n=1 Tax=Hymenobacter edaphi TaxID=2211146 RepID=UPI001057F054|nr:hypothetical protein [Hymenobacter edaphi]